MKTINERKAQKNIFISFIFNHISIFFIGFGIKQQEFIITYISIIIYFISLYILCYNFYSLGWEYKRISIEEGSEKNTETNK